jgi:GMP synthase (glutamine-hydrolysing)
VCLFFRHRCAKKRQFFPPVLSEILYFSGYAFWQVSCYNTAMSVLILKNVPTEGPGTIEDFLRDSGMIYRIVEMSQEDLPPYEKADTLIILGGYMSANETDIYPYITREIELVKEFIGKGKKVFGVCLGAQIMARALGARVYAGPQKEIGWHDIELLEEGLKDSLITKLATHPVAGDFRQKFKVFHWHGETFDLPAGARRIASSALYPNQAFSYGSNAYAFQFHIEVKKETILEWMKNEPVDIEKIRQETAAYYEECSGRAQNFYRGFFAGGREK